MYPVLPHKKGFKPRPLGHKQYIYEPVSFGTDVKDEPLELILTQFVEGKINKAFLSFKICCFECRILFNFANFSILLKD
jgi:hypothetical protein